jgi:hypothetical protein
MADDIVVYEIADKAAVSVEDIQQAVADAWSEMRQPGTDAYEDAKRAGIDVAALPASVDDVVEVRPHGAGVGAVEVAIIGFLGKVAYDVWKDVWTHILLPKVKKRFGEKALTPTSDGSSGAG